MNLPEYHCAKVSAFEVDGNLEKSVWRAASVVRLKDTTGRPRRIYPTTLRVCYSETHLYLGYRCTDPQIECTYVKRDDPLYEEEVVEAFLSPTGDLHHYFEFEFNAKNTVFDARVFSPYLGRREMEVDTAWDSLGLKSAVRLSQNRAGVSVWSVEVGLPFADMKVPTPQKGTHWRANFYRIDRAQGGEFSAWSPTLTVPADFHVPERFGWLVF